MYSSTQCTAFQESHTRKTRKNNFNSNQVPKVPNSSNLGVLGYLGYQCIFFIISTEYWFAKLSKVLEYPEYRISEISGVIEYPEYRIPKLREDTGSWCTKFQKSKHFPVPRVPNSQNIACTRVLKVPSS